MLILSCVTVEKKTTKNKFYEYICTCSGIKTMNAYEYCVMKNTMLDPFPYESESKVCYEKLLKTRTCNLSIIECK